MVDKLSKKKLPKGSSPEDTSVNAGVTGWPEIVAKGLTHASDKWVQMHLINAGLGGEGKPYNLVPGPNSVNSGSMRTYEDTAKRLVKKDDRNVVWLKTTVSYRSGSRADYAGSIRMEAGLYVHKGGKEWVKDAKVKLENTSPVPAPVFSEGAVPRLSAPSHTLLSSITLGNKTYQSVFTQTVVGRIKTVVKEDGAFGTLTGFESKMKAHNFKELTTKTGRENWLFKLTAFVFPAVRELHANKKLRIR